MTVCDDSIGQNGSGCIDVMIYIHLTSESEAFGWQNFNQWCIVLKQLKHFAVKKRLSSRELPRPRFHLRQSTQCLPRRRIFNELKRHLFHPEISEVVLHCSEVRSWSSHVSYWWFGTKPHCRTCVAEPSSSSGFGTCRPYTVDRSIGFRAA